MTLAEASQPRVETAARRRRDRLRTRSSRALLGALLLLPAATAGVRIFRGGLPALAYDECEYARQMLDTGELLFQRGLLSWPQIIASEQPYAKPPLLVDLAAGVLLLVGQLRPVAAIAVTMMAVTALTVLATFRLVRDLFSASTALLAVFALGAIPAGGLFASKLFPEPLVTLLLVLLLAVLFAPQPRRATTRMLLLAAVVCGGLLAKSTFPVLAAGPLLVSLVDPRHGGGGTRETRGWVFGGTALGVAASAIWYASNLGDAFGYARDAYDWASWMPASLGELVHRWIRIVSWQALGVSLTAIVLTVAVLMTSSFWKRRQQSSVAEDGGARQDGEGLWRPLRREQRRFLVAVAAAALPTIAIAMPSPNVSSRLLLPAFSLLAVGAVIALAEARLRGVARAVRSVLLVGMLLQWGAIQIGGLSPVRAWAAPAPISRALRVLNPYFGPLDRHAIQPLESLLRATAPLAWAARALGPLQPTLYFVENYPELDLSRFQLYQAVRGAELPVRWLCYFEWPEQRRATALAAAREGRSLVVSYRPQGLQRPDLEFLNRQGEECLRDVRDPASGFRKVRDLAPPGATYALELYANFELPAAPALSFERAS